MTTPELVAWIKKNPISVGCGVLSLALAVALYFRSDAIAEANQTLDEKTAEAQRYALNLANSAQLKEQLDALTTADKVIESRLIHASDLGINQQFFFKLESESGVKLLDLRQAPRPGSGGKAYVPIGFNVSLQGDFGQVMKFLRLLEDGAHYCRTLTATCSGNRTGGLTLTLNLELLGTP